MHGHNYIKKRPACGGLSAGGSFLCRKNLLRWRKNKGVKEEVKRKEVVSSQESGEKQEQEQEGIRSQNESRR